MSRALTIQQHIAAPPDQVYRAFTTGTALREWLSEMATTSTKVGGYLFVAWDDGYYAAGQFTALEDGQRVAFTWHGRDEPARTAVDVALKPTRGGTEVTVTHTIGEGDAWDAFAAEVTRGWEMSLENLASVLGKGPDLRIVRRPMLGIILSDFDETIAAREGVPVSKGMRIDDVVAGMGAAAAGLTSGDVIVEIGGHAIVDWASLSHALSAHHAGDEVPVTFYRGSAKQTVSMRLSGRPLPTIPDSVAALAEALQARMNAVDKELGAFLDGLTDVEADFQPAEDAWSVKETLAHLIHGERGWQQYIGELVTGQEPWHDDYGGNLAARTQATVAVNPTLADLRAAHRHAQAETVALISRLPAAFVKERDKFWRLAYYTLEPPYHFHSHLAQMEAAVAAAREAQPA